MDSALSMLGLALRARRLEVGEDPVGDACRARRCRLLLVAADAAEASRRRAAHYAAGGQCLLAEIPWTKEELGAALGRKSCAMAALTDLGLARALAEKLARAEPERYGEMAQRLRLKAERAARRREEAAGERQQRGGGKRPPVKYKKR